MTVISVLLSFFSIVALITLHEIGHFAMAKKFGVKVEEFGLGYPPRLWGKQIGETIYTINLLPLGGFVRMLGEEDNTIREPRSFAGQAVWKRAGIVLGGVVMFWVMAAVLFGVVSFTGTRTVVPDNASTGLVQPEVNISAIAPGSPAEKAGIKAGDSIESMSYQGTSVTIDNITQVQTFISQHYEQEINMVLGRGADNITVSLTPRSNPPQGQGSIGVALVRTAIKSYPWYEAPWQGIVNTWNMTTGIVVGYANLIVNLFKHQPLGVQMVGPVRLVFDVLPQAQALGVSYFVNFLAMLSVYLAVFNILPIPALDGGKMLFLGIEAIRKRPVSQKVEQNVTMAFFVLLLILMLVVTINDLSIIL